MLFIFWVRSHLYQGFGIAFEPEGILSCLRQLLPFSRLINQCYAESLSVLAKLNNVQLLILWGDG